MKPAAKKTAARKSAQVPAAPEVADTRARLANQDDTFERAVYEQLSGRTAGCPHTRVKPLNEPDAAGNTEQCAACGMRRKGADGEWRAQPAPTN